MGRTILLADDSVTIQKVVELTFMDEDYAVVAVSNGDDALRAIDETAPDLVITDLHMPGAGGLEVCRRAKEIGLPVLLLVGTFEPFQPEEADAAGVDGVVRKPFDSQELLQRVADLMAAGASGPVEVGDADAFEIESSPWSDAEESAADPVEVTRADGLISTDTIGATLEARFDSAPAADDETDATDAMPVHSGRQAGQHAGQSAGQSVVEEPPGPISERFAAITGDRGDSGTDDSSQGNGGGLALSVDDVDRVARRVVELLGETTLREVAWEVVPDLAEVVIKDRIRELERQIE